MEKPVDYKLSNKLPYSQWKQEWKDYKNWRSRNNRHPELKDLSEEERIKHRLKIKLNNLEKSHIKYRNCTQEEKDEWNKHKVENNWYKLSEDEKKRRIEPLINGSINFWKNMTPEERHEFAIHRWNNISEDDKNKIISNIKTLSKIRYENLTQEELDLQIKRMQKGLIDKINNDKDFREYQNSKLIENCKNFWNSLSEDERYELRSKILSKANERNKYLWENDIEYREKQIQHLRNHCRDYIDSLSEDELKEHSITLNQNLQKFYDSMTSKERREILNDNKLNERFEKYFDNSNLSNKFYYIKEYKVLIDNSNFKFWDYAIYNKDTNNLEMVVDIDGEYFHGDSCDYNGLQSKEERDEKRSFYIPYGVKFSIIYEKDFIKSFSLMIENLNISLDEFYNKIFKMCRSMSFPYPKYNNNNELLLSFNQLKKMNCNDKYHKNLSLDSRIGDRLIIHFHESIYHINIDNDINPYKAWYDDKILKKLTNDNMIIHSYINHNKILQGFNISDIGQRIHIISAAKCKMIVNKYLSEYNIIIDPYMKFGEIMLSVIVCNKSYIGICNNKLNIDENKEMLRFLENNNIEIDKIKIYDNMKFNMNYDCLFTILSYYQNQDNMIDYCLNNFKCKRYLFISNNTERYKQYVVEEIKHKIHIKYNIEYIIIIDK